MGRRILLTGTEGWGIDQAASALGADGHVLLSCNDRDETKACRLATENPCPIIDRTEVVLTVRAHPLAGSTRQEQCVSCAAAAGIPVVVAGCPYPNPFAEDTSEIVEGIAGIGDACEAAISIRASALAMTGGVL